MKNILFLVSFFFLSAPNASLLAEEIADVADQSPEQRISGAIKMLKGCYDLLHYVGENREDLGFLDSPKQGGRLSLLSYGRPLVYAVKHLLEGPGMPASCKFLKYVKLNDYQHFDDDPCKPEFSAIEEGIIEISESPGSISPLEFRLIKKDIQEDVLNLQVALGRILLQNKKLKFIK